MPYEPEILKDSGVEAQQGRNQAKESLPIYKEIELGDVQNKNPAQPPQNTNNQQSNKPKVANPPVDPTAFWSQISNTGYKPSAKLMHSASDLIVKGKTDWADTWFSVLLQKIIKKIKTSQV